MTVLFAFTPGDQQLPSHTRGSIWNPRTWIKVIRDGGTTAYDFAGFLDKNIENTDLKKGQICEARCRQIRIFDGTNQWIRNPND